MNRPYYQPLLMACLAAFSLAACSPLDSNSPDGNTSESKAPAAETVGDNDTPAASSELVVANDPKPTAATEATAPEENGAPGSKEAETNSEASITIQTTATSKTPEKKLNTYTETGDIDAIKRHGTLRILVPPFDESSTYLPRVGSPLSWQRDVAQDFAKKLKLKPILIPMDSFENAVPMLLRGEVDVIAANLTVTPERKQLLTFSQPFTHVNEQLITRADDKALRRPADLIGRTVTADPRSVFWEGLVQLSNQHTGVNLEAAPMVLDESVIDLLNAGIIDTTVLQSNLVETLQAYRDDFRVAFNVAEHRPLAWAMRPNARELKKRLDNYLVRQHLVGEKQPQFTGDWAAIKKRGVLRVLLRNNAVSYFLWRGELVGFEYELLSAFAKQHKLRLEVVVPDNYDGLFTGLTEGEGDIAAGFLSPEEQQRPGIIYSRTYHKGPQMLLARPGDPIRSLDDLWGRNVVVRSNSAYWGPLQRLFESGANFNLQAAPEDMETEDVVFRVGLGEFDLTVAGGPTGDMPPALLPGVLPVLPLGEPHPSAWAVRDTNPDLLDKLNHFVRKNRRGKKFFNILWFKYFSTTGRMASLSKEASENASIRTQGELSPFDDLAKQYAERYGFDWRLIISQMYQESRFDPKRKSWAGAEGLMQVMPRTAGQMGFKNVKHPESGIHAGVKYLDWLRNQLDEDLPFRSRTWFTLASYNAGLGHVIDARRLAQKKGWNPNLWFDNVERAMLLLAQPKYSKQARHGYVRGSEPVNYVRNIRARYNAYLLTSEVALGN